MAETEFFRTLQRLGLQQYHDSLVAEAFDSWPVLSQITEQDMTTLGIRLGHRRILQNAIAQYKNASGISQPLPAANSHDHGREPEGSPASTNGGSGTSEKAVQRQKRKYIRHPKNDENAPPRPPTGYVIFSNWVREHIKDEGYNFPEIAKLVGKRWRTIPKHEKDWFEAKAKEQKAVYAQEMALYKRTAKYREYQKYLLEFNIRTGKLPPARRNGRARSEMSLDDDDDDDDDDDSARPNSGHFDDTVSGASNFGQADLPPVRSSLDRSMHTLPQLRSPGQLSPTTTSIPPVAALTSTALAGSAPAHKYQLSGANSPPTSYNRLPSANNNASNRQLPPLPMPQFRP